MLLRHLDCITHENIPGDAKGCKRLPQDGYPRKDFNQGRQLLWHTHVLETVRKHALEPVVENPTGIGS